MFYEGNLENLSAKHAGYSTCKLLLVTKSAGKQTQLTMGSPRSVTAFIQRRLERKNKSIACKSLWIIVSGRAQWKKWNNTSVLVLYRDTISLQTRGFFNSNLGRVRIILPDQPVLPDWELVLAKLTLLWKDDQFGDHKLCQFGRFAFHLLAGIDPTDHSSDKSYRSSFAMTKIIKNCSF